MPTTELTYPARIGELFERYQFIGGFAFLSLEPFEVWHAQRSKRLYT
jgi:hypothetical protein